MEFEKIQIAESKLWILISPSLCFNPLFGQVDASNFIDVCRTCKINFCSTESTEFEIPQFNNEELKAPKQKRTARPKSKKNKNKKVIYKETGGYLPMPEDPNKKTLLLDLDETLVHTDFTPNFKFDRTLKVNLDGNSPVLKPQVAVSSI